MGARTVHPFPARMAPDIAIDHLADITSAPTLILDPMCGSGTVLAAASSRGFNAIGFDVDPLAVLMSSVATSPIDTDELAFEVRQVIARAEAQKDETPRWFDQETEKFAELVAPYLESLAR